MNPKHEIGIFGAGVVAGAMWLAMLQFGTHGEPVFMTNFSAPEIATLLAGFGGAIVGAIVGGVISWLLARQTAKEVRRRDQEARNAQEKTTVLQTFLKVMQVANGTYTIEQNIENSIKAAALQGVADTPLWEIVLPVAGGMEPPKFASEDLVPFAVSGNSELINRISEASSRYKALEEGFRTYAQHRLKFHELAAPYTVLNPDGQSSTVFPPGVASIAKMMAHEMESLITDVRKASHRDTAALRVLSADIDSFAKLYFKDKGGFVSLTSDPE